MVEVMVRSEDELWLKFREFVRKRYGKLKGNVNYQNWGLFIPIFRLYEELKEPLNNLEKR